MKTKAYFHICIRLKSDSTPKVGVREFDTYDSTTVYNMVMNQLTNKDDIMKVDVWQLFPFHSELQEYLKKDGEKR